MRKQVIYLIVFVVLQRNNANETKTVRKEIQKTGKYLAVTVTILNEGVNGVNRLATKGEKYY